MVEIVSFVVCRFVFLVGWSSVQPLFGRSEVIWGMGGIYYVATLSILLKLLKSEMNKGSK